VCTLCACFGAVRVGGGWGFFPSDCTGTAAATRVVSCGRRWRKKRKVPKSKKKAKETNYLETRKFFSQMPTRERSEAGRVHVCVVRREVEYKWTATTHNTKKKYMSVYKVM
jgi:hypothetical protein